jgi:hypothetical protein
MSWYYAASGVKNGPVSEDDLRALAASGRLLPTDLVWSEGMTDWLPAASIPGLLPAGAPGGDPALRWLLPVGRSGWAIAAGYLGIFSLLGIFAPFAVVAGILGLRHIKQNPHLGGRGRAIFGIVMGGLVMLMAGALLLMPLLSR